LNVDRRATERTRSRYQNYCELGGDGRRAALVGGEIGIVEAERLLQDEALG
jgi:hypothetical protein